MRDAAGEFLCFGFFVSRSVLLAPDVSGEYFWLHRGSAIKCGVKRRSRRHYFVLLEAPTTAEEEDDAAVYQLSGGDQPPSSAKRQACRIHSVDIIYSLIIERWVCSSQGAYHLQLSTRADPRLNGRVVVYADTGKLVGMAISPAGFAGQLLCVPADVIATHLLALELNRLDPKVETRPFTRLIPPIMLQRVSESTSRHAAFGDLRGNFRTADLRAEIGASTIMPMSCSHNKGGSLRVTGSRDPDFSWLKYEPFLEVGNFVFRSDRFGKVECVAEVATDEDLQAIVDEVVSECACKVLASVNDAPTPTFQSLVDYLSLNTKSDGAAAYTLKWADDRVQEVIKKTTAVSFGRRISPQAFVWYSKTTASIEEEEVPAPTTTAKERAESLESCVDPCCIVLL